MISFKSDLSLTRVIRIDWPNFYMVCTSEKNILKSIQKGGGKRGATFEKEVNQYRVKPVRVEWVSNTRTLTRIGLNPTTKIISRIKLSELKGSACVAQLAE